MFKIFHNKKGQNTAEYAILISLVIAGIIAMQTYAQRALQARVRDGAQFMVDNTNTIGATDQYEPYYLEKNMTNTNQVTDTKTLSGDETGIDMDATATRAGTSVDTYDGITGH